MTIDHVDFRERFADDDRSDAITAHRLACPGCDAWATRLQAVLATAPVLSRLPGDIDLTDSVLAATHPLDGAASGGLTSTAPPPQSRSSSRWLSLAAAAAVVVVVAAGAIAFTRQSGRPTDSFADVADSYRSQDAVRFVIDASTTAGIDDLRLDITEPAPIEPVNVLLPACLQVEGSAPSPVDTAVDLSDFTQLFDTDTPCLSLDAVGGELAAQATKVIADLNERRNRLQVESEALAAAQIDDPLRAVVASALSTKVEGDLAAIDTAIGDIDTQLRSLRETLQPVADASANGLSPVGFLDAARDEVQQFDRTVDASNQVLDAADGLSVTLDQLATGSITDGVLAASGGTTTPGGATEFATIDDDPLGLIAQVLGAPGGLGAILDSAPAVDDERVTWVVPTDIVGPPTGGIPWTATAQRSGNELTEIDLVSGSTRITITLGR